MLIQCLKMQPTDVVTADMFTTVGCCFVIKQLRFNASRFDKHLLLTARFKSDKPKRCVVNTVLTGCLKTMVLMKNPAMSANGFGNGQSTLFLDSNSTT